MKDQEKEVVRMGKTKVFLRRACFEMLLPVLGICCLEWVSPECVQAKTDNASSSSKMEMRSLESRRVRQEPAFFQTGSGIRWQGVFFGVGFRHLSFGLENGQTLDSISPTKNGVAFNLGLFSEEEAYEFERQVSIVDAGRTMKVGNQSGKRLEVVQNTLSYSWFPRVLRDLYVQLGFGLQGSRSRFAATGSHTISRTDAALCLQLGTAYFATTNLMLLLRFSESRRLGPELSGEDAFLKSSRIRTFFLNYYFAL